MDSVHAIANTEATTEVEKHSKAEGVEEGTPVAKKDGIKEIPDTVPAGHAQGLMASKHAAPAGSSSPRFLYSTSEVSLSPF